jgi:hypothetical protein
MLSIVGLTLEEIAALKVIHFDTILLLASRQWHMAKADLK